jgi:hypothetical protein
MNTYEQQLKKAIAHVNKDRHTQIELINVDSFINFKVYCADNQSLCITALEILKRHGACLGNITHTKGKLVSYCFMDEDSFKALVAYNQSF